MPVDLAGTAPGLVENKEEPKPLMLHCRREGCDSMQAFEIKMANAPGRHIYRCAKCHHTWGVNVGGSIDF